MFLEAVDPPKVVAFYERSRFYQFSVRQVQDGSSEPMKLIQMRPVRRVGGRKVSLLLDFNLFSKGSS